MTLGRILPRLALVVTLSVWASVAAATAITLSFAGTLTSSFGSLNAGDAFSGSYTFDPSIAANGGSTSSTSVFDNLFSASLTIGGFTATVGPGVGLAEIQQDNGVSGADRYALTARNAVGSSQIGGLDVTLFGFRLDDTTETAIADALVLLTNPSLSSFTSNTFLIFLGQPTDQDFKVIDGTLTSLTVAQVPEPATWVLLGLGLAASGFVRARRSA